MRTLLLLLIIAAARARAQLLFGCAYEAGLCQSDEVCVDDGVFAQCQSAPGIDAPPLVLDEDDVPLISAQLERLIDAGYGWRDAITQCTVAHWMLTVRYDLAYDPEFCNTEHPENILNMVHEVQGHLGGEQHLASVIADKLGIPSADDTPVAVVYEDDGSPSAVVTAADVAADDTPLADIVRDMLATDTQTVAIDDDSVTDVSKKNDVVVSANDQTVATVDEPLLSADEAAQLDALTAREMGGEDISDEVRALTDDQLSRYIATVQNMRQLLFAQQHYLQNDDTLNDETVEPVAVIAADDGQVALLKKDDEHMGDTELGLENTEHKIVKGELSAKKGDEALHYVEGDRVYVKLDKNLMYFAQNLTKLMDYLTATIAVPRGLSFSDEHVAGNELSFRVTSADDNIADTDAVASVAAGVRPLLADTPRSGVLLSTEVADLINKRRTDVQKVSGASVVEWGVGDVDNHIAISPTEADRFSQWVTGAVGTLMVVAVVAGVGMYAYSHRRHAKEMVSRLAADIESRPAKTYEELCRQRMSSRGESAPSASSASGRARCEATADTVSPTHRLGSTGSWPDETATTMDIGTGHMILAYMEQHLANAEKLAEEWSALSAYLPDVVDTTAARASYNESKNRDMAHIPYDHNRVRLASMDDDYVNASFVCDAAPTKPEYIATQTPLPDTTDDFWRMVWEQGSVVLVNLCRQDEHVDEATYWPQDGSAAYGPYEVHLVSEHMWCEDYIVRSFYLKNTGTQETRTITQFHYVNWPSASPPSTPDSLLEFRRKVNKSYRGNGSPMLVHCSTGGDRTGAYIAIDITLKRISKGGVKQMDIVATVEHMRDQRMNLIENSATYEFVLTAIAHETHAVLDALRSP